MSKQKTLMSQKNIENSWRLVNAQGKVLGRLATQIATALSGKDKVDYAPHIDNGDFVVVVNCRELVIKNADKVYQWHTGFPGGIKSEKATHRLEKHPERVLFLAVKRMLPRNILRNAMLKKLKLFPGAEHLHAAQNPQQWLNDDE
ncbi:MAG TPA: 50S ribosomal protein L13 [Gammaproteobacteria bacterium]|nr:50S ribosomal protein L13 [Gammaproteobacteria bacterium]